MTVAAALVAAVTLSACQSTSSDNDGSPTGATALGDTTPASPSSAVPEFPDAQSTGVPAGVELEPSDSLRITQDGTVIDGLHVNGVITIDADDVTIRNTLVQTGTSLYPIKVTDDTTGAVIENVEVDNEGGTGIGIYLQGAATVRNANIHSAEDGIRIQEDNVLIEDSYIHDLQPHEGGHHDSIQIRNGDNVTIRGNNLQAYVPSLDTPLNASLQIGSLAGDHPISNLQVIGNLMNGGNYTINGGRSGDTDSAHYADNRFGDDYRYGAVGNLQDGSVWEDTNVWHDTGEPVTR
ncbi:right-handed parallel beta-helix repeat-containing protein [Janibacter cremeus]|uniref:Right handed beta helix domain-containing protein n=1 Tax=Janibacter cremeus TaxID=1285192 RepID=A0A852VPX9_9MICO|nr:hypothetical protein [Janibacter cremeus]